MADQKVVLKVQPKHPKKSYRIGRHVIGPDFAEYELNEQEQKELASPGPARWVIVQGQAVVDPAPTKAEKSVKGKKEKKEKAE